MLKTARCLLALVLLCGIGPSAVSKADGTKFIGRLPKDCTLELVGITDDTPTKQSRWWRPDGSAVDLGPFQSPGAHHGHPDAGTKLLTFLVRFKSPAADSPASPSKTMSTGISSPSLSKYPPAGALALPLPEYLPTDVPAWGINPSGPLADVYYIAHSYTGIMSQRMNLFTPHWAGGAVTDATGNYVPYHWTFSAVFGASAVTADFRVGISMCEWKTVAVQQPDRTGGHTFNWDGQQWGVAFHKAKTVHKTVAGASIDGMQVGFTTTLKWPESYGKLTHRVVAVGTDGSVHTLSFLDSGPVFQDLPLSSIKEFRFQVRPYYWVEFQNVSLQPGQKRYVEVVSPDAPEKTEK